ncbi:hypothetical protein EAF04_001004 [Stromatinia cepivora]|nr:hypothetical protein EAF04_001004 [Stromatinia cepivora]
MFFTTILDVGAGIYVFFHILNFVDITPMLGSKIYRTFPSLFPQSKSNPVDPILEAASRMAAERRLLYPDFNYTMRTVFHTRGCTIYGYPSSGGIFIKENADIVDMNVLSLDRFHPTQQSPDPIEEDGFCTLMRKIGAIWWKSVHHREKEWTSLKYGYQHPGGGAWVPRYDAHEGMEHLLPGDFGRIKMAMAMDERLEVMREFGAVFYEKEEDVEELGDKYSNVGDDECL